MKGVLIVFEGIDGSGKSTQIELLARRLAGRPREVVRTAEPTRGPVGKELRRRWAEGPPLAPREELDLFVTDRYQHVNSVVAPAMLRGAIVLQDRSVMSTAAYQGDRPGIGLSPMAIMAQCAGHAPMPAATILLDADPTVAMARIADRPDRDPCEELFTLRKVRSRYLAIAWRMPAITIIDATQDQDAVATAVWRAVEKVV